MLALGLAALIHAGALIGRGLIGEAMHGASLIGAWVGRLGVHDVELASLSLIMCLPHCLSLRLIILVIVHLINASR